MQILNARTVGSNQKSCIIIDNGRISNITERSIDMSSSTDSIDAQGSLVIPGLVHSHIHLDKCFLLDRCQIKKGDFDEAMKITAQAKINFTKDDVVKRGRRLILQSISHGVIGMRAHVEVDPDVKLECLEAAIELKNEFKDRCEVQIAVFAQDSIIARENADVMQELLKNAACRKEVSAIGSAPYVDKNQKANVDFVMDLASEHDLLLDFHLDYNLEPEDDDKVVNNDDDSSKALIWYVLEKAKQRGWTSPIALGHCTRICTFTTEKIQQLATEAASLDVTFIGLPPSDLYMMGRKAESLQPRGTLPLGILQDHGLQTALAVNNVANAFTPQGDADPLSLLPLGIALYQDATPMGLERTMSMVTNRSALAIGLPTASLEIQPNQPADLVILHGVSTLREGVLSPPFDRTVVYQGRVVARRHSEKWVAE